MDGRFKRLFGIHGDIDVVANRFIVKFNGGLGNQMFQWAFARSLA